MMAECTGGKPEYQTLQPFPAVMGLALGKTAVSYTPGEGTREGEDLMKTLFGKDMGHTSVFLSSEKIVWIEKLTRIAVCWNYMRLGEAC